MVGRPIQYHLTVGIWQRCNIGLETSRKSGFSRVSVSDQKRRQSHFSRLVKYQNIPYSFQVSKGNSMHGSIMRKVNLHLIVFHCCVLQISVSFAIHGMTAAVVIITFGKVIAME